MIVELCGIFIYGLVTLRVTASCAVKIYFFGSYNNIPLCYLKNKRSKKEFENKKKYKRYIFSRFQNFSYSFLFFFFLILTLSCKERKTNN